MALPQDETTTEKPSIDYEALGLKPVSDEELFGFGLQTEAPEAPKAETPEIDYEALGLEPVSEKELFGFEMPKEEPEAPSDWDTLRGAEIALRQVPQLAYGVAGLVGATSEQITGYGEALRDWGFRGYKEWEESMEPISKETDDITVAWQRAQEGDIGALVDWAQYGIGYGLGQLGETAAVAVLGGLAGGAVGAPAGGIGAAPAAAGGAIAAAASKQGFKALAKNLVEKAIASQAEKIAIREAEKKGVKLAGEQLAKEASQAAIKRQAAKEIGSDVAIFGNAIGMQLGSIYGEAESKAQAEGRDLTGYDLARVWGTGLATGGIEGVVDKFGLDLLRGKLSAALPEGRLAGAAIAGGVGTLGEAGTEAIQTVGERIGAGKDILSDEAINEYINAAALGGISGGGIGGVGGFISGNQRENAAAKAKVVAEASKTIAPETANEVAKQANEVIQEVAQETPDQRVTRLKAEAQAAREITLEEQPPVAGLPPVEPTPPVTPTPEAAVAPVETVAPEGEAQPITATRTVEDAIRDKDTFIYNDQRGAVSVEDGVTVFRPFGTQDKFEIGINPNQTIGEIEGIQWARKGQARAGAIEAKPETAIIIESQPAITIDEVDQSEPDFDVPPALIEIEKSQTLNDLADLFDTGDSKVVQEGKRARKVSETPEFYRQVTPQQIGLAQRLVDNALRIIDALPVSDQQKQDMAEPYLLLDQDITNYESNPEYQRYKASIRTEVRPAGEAGVLPETETEVAAGVRELEQRAKVEAERLEREATARRVAAGRAVFIPTPEGAAPVTAEPATAEARFSQFVQPKERPDLAEFPDFKSFEMEVRGVPVRFDIDSTKSDESTLYLESFRVPREERRQGIGREAMTNLINWANENNVTLKGEALTAPADRQYRTPQEIRDQGYMTSRELFNFYQTLGWERDPEGPTKTMGIPMVYRPKPTAVEPPTLAPLRRVVRAEQTEEDVAGLVDAGFVEVYNGQPVLTQAGIDVLPEAERPRLTPEARKIQIDTGASDVVAEAISKRLRIGVDQVPFNFQMPAGWVLEGDVYIPSRFTTIEELYSDFDARGAGHARFRTRLDSMVNEEALTGDARDMILATLFDSNVNDEFLMNIEAGSLSARAIRVYGRGGFERQRIAGPTGPTVGYKPSLKLFRNTRKVYPDINERSAQVLSTFWHEFGHVGYYTLLDQKQKNIIDAEFNKTTKDQRQKFFEEGVAGAKQTEWFRKYYAKNQSEWFAQSFAEYVLTKKSDNKKLVPAFESILNKIKNVFNKLFNRTETVKLEDIFDFVLRGEAYGTKPVWYGYGIQMSREPSIYTGGPQIIRGARETAPPTRINIWQAPEQEITSQETSINERKIPAVFNQVRDWVEGTINADIGGGRFDNVTNWLRERGVTNLIIDWFNRDRAFNEANINRVRGGQADTATISNVLNVIQEPNARDLVIRQAADAIKEDGTAYFYIYEGNGSGDGRATAKGWQENRKASTYIDEISRHFGSVERRNQMIIARNPINEAGVMAAMEAPAEAPIFTEESPEAATLKEMEASMAKVDAASEAKGGKPETQKISDIAANWMDQGGDERALQDAIVENTNLTPANAARVAKAIARQYDIQQSIATAFLETQTGLSVEALPEGVALPKEVDPDRPKPVMQRLFDVFMGVRVPPTKITVNEKTALKQQIRLKAAANRAAKAAQKETSDQVIEVIKSMDLRGGVRPKQVQALAKRAAKVIWTNEKSLETFADYAAKVVENANYDADLREAKAAQARAKQLSKQKKVAMGPQREMLDNISKIAVNRLDDPRMYADVVNYYLRGFKAVLSPDYVVVPDSEMTSYLSQMQSEATRNQRDLDRAVNERLAEKYGVDIDDLNSVLEAADIISQLEANENREAMDNLLTEKAIETRDGLKAYDQTPLRADQRKLVDAIMKVDPKALDAEERQRFIRITNNIIYNNQTNGAEYFASVAKGQQSARAAAQDSDMIAKNKAWINLLPRLVSERMQRGWALELQSVADTFRNAFGKGAMAKVYKAMGMLDLNMGFTKANNTIDEIQEKIAEFHTKLEKKYKAAARNQDGLLAEGVAGFLIQKVPNKGETESIAQRRDLIRQDIANRRGSGEVDRMAMADRIETILNQIDGEGVQAVLNNLKQTYPANHESLVWYKDTLLPQYKDFLKNFDENFNDQANNYDNPDYLPIAFSKASPSLAITKEEEQVFYDQVSLRPKQAANTIKRLDYVEIPRDRTTGAPKEIEFNLRRNAFDSLSDQINKAYTSSAWQQLASFMKTPESEVVFGGKANKDFFIERLNRLRLSRMRRGAMSRGNIERAVDSLSVISRKLGTGIALGGVYQWIKQPPDQLVTALGSGGRYDLMAQNIMPKNQKAARELLRKFSIGRRGDASSGYKYINQMEGHQNRLERYFSESKWDQVKEEGSKIADVWMAALKRSDFWAASTAWMTYYEGELNKRNIKIEDWAKEAELVDTDPARQEAAAFAEQMTDIYQGSSDPTQMATFAQSGKSGWENLMKAIFVPFNSFAIQQRIRLYSDARDVLNGEKSGVGGLTGTIGGLLLFHATKRLALPVISGGIATILYGLLGVDMEEPDEEKQKEEANKRWRQMQGEMLGNLLVGGTPQIVEAKFIDAMNYASYLISLQLESESILNDEGEVMAFDQYAKERSPFWRYRSFDNAMSLGMLDIGLGQAEQAILQTKMVADPEEMEMYTPEEQRLLYFSTLSEWLYLMRLNDADFARIVSRARRDMMSAAKEREKQIKAIQSGR